MNGTDKNEMDKDRAVIAHFMADFPLLNAGFNRFYNSAPFVAVFSTLTLLLCQLGEGEEILDLVGTPSDVN
jgi:TM2 domain-containing membrane protein YozV